jgi:hypothetical protein
VNQAVNGTEIRLAIRDLHRRRHEVPAQPELQRELLVDAEVVLREETQEWIRHHRIGVHHVSLNQVRVAEHESGE